MLTPDQTNLYSLLQSFFQRVPIATEEQVMKEFGFKEVADFRKQLENLESIQLRSHNISLNDNQTVTVYWFSCLLVPEAKTAATTNEGKSHMSLEHTSNDNVPNLKSNHLDKPSPALLQRLKRCRRTTNTHFSVSMNPPLKKQKISTAAASETKEGHDENVRVEEQERRLRVQLFERKKTVEELRKNLQKKVDAEKHQDEIRRLQELIEKWRSACQEALLEIKTKVMDTSSSHDITLRHLLAHFQIDPKKLNYDEETDSFL
jgi:hypothetical protein